MGVPALKPQISTPRAPGEPVAPVAEDGVVALPRKHSLLWHLAVIDVSVLVVIVLLLAFTPVTIHAPLRPIEAVILLAGFLVIAAANLLLLQRAVAPLHQLSEVMRSIDPGEPGRRLSVAGMRDAELAALAESFNAMLDRLELERRQSALRALSAQEGERLRVARELHDEIGQTLTAIALDAERAAVASEGKDREAWERVAVWAQQSVEDLRRIARRLRPEALDDLGLINAFISLCNRMSEYGGLPITRSLPDGLPERSPEVDLVVYRVAQEALWNAVRHAEASAIEVTLSAVDDRLVLSVRDDGRGLEAGAESTARNGLRGMRERAMLVGGALAIVSQPGEGAEVKLEVPLEPARRCRSRPGSCWPMTTPSCVADCAWFSTPRRISRLSLRPATDAKLSRPRWRTRSIWRCSTCRCPT
jgi:two-component system sensor histidine kinase UhpB